MLLFQYFLLLFLKLYLLGHPKRINAHSINTFHKMNFFFSFFFIPNKKKIVPNTGIELNGHFPSDPSKRVSITQFFTKSYNKLREKCFFFQIDKVRIRKFWKKERKRFPNFVFCYNNKAILVSCFVTRREFCKVFFCPFLGRFPTKQSFESLHSKILF